MDLIKSSDKRYETYENLLLERDQLLKEAGSIWTGYLKTFGELITEGYREKVECIRLRKTIAYYQAALNHGGAVDPEAMQQYLAEVMAQYEAELKRKMSENAAAGKAGTSSAYEVQRARTLYRRLARLLHPDINPETDRQMQLKELWQQILDAYRRNDLKALSELEVLTRKALRELGVGEIRVEIPYIESRIGELEEEIDEIRTTEPYIYRDLLENDEAVARKMSELEEELAKYRRYRGELEAVVEEMLQNGGIRLQWHMK